MELYKSKEAKKLVAEVSEIELVLVMQFCIASFGLEYSS